MGKRLPIVDGDYLKTQLMRTYLYNHRCVGLERGFIPPMHGYHLPVHDERGLPSACCAIRYSKINPYTALQSDYHLLR